MNDKVQMVVDIAINAVLFPVSTIECITEFKSTSDCIQWYIDQDIVGPWLYTQVSSAVEALEETGINAGFYAPILSDVESFFEMMFC